LGKFEFQKGPWRKITMQYELEAVIIGFRFIADFRQDKNERSLVKVDNLTKKKDPPILLFYNLPNSEKKDMVLN